MRLGMSWEFLGRLVGVLGRIGASRGHFVFDVHAKR